MRPRWILAHLLSAILIMPSLACRPTPEPPTASAPTAAASATSMPVRTPTVTPSPVPTQTPAAYSVAEIVDQLSPSVVLIVAELPDDEWGSGTGIIYDATGLVVTNAHVVAGASIIKASVPGRSSWISAKILGLSPCDDLAVIDLEGSGFTPAILGESDDLKLGQAVVAIGYPLAGDLDTQLTVNQGIVSKLKTQLDQLTDLIQTDTPINPGNSGGPLVNLRGEVVGINTIKVEYTSSGRPVQGINFAIGVSLAKEAMAELERGENRHWLGLNMVTNDQEVAEHFSLPTAEGMLVYAVADGSPAAEAGLETGDILLRLKGVTVQSESDVCDVLRSHRVGDLLPIEIMRGEVTLEGAIGGASLVASAQPPPLPFDEGVPSLALYNNEELGVAFPYPEGWFIDEQDNKVTLESPEGNVSLLFGLYDVPAGTTAEEVMERTIGDLSEDYPDLEVVATDSWMLSGELEAVLNGVVFTNDVGELRWAFLVEMVQETTNYTLILTGDETTDPEMYGEVLGEIVDEFEVLASPDGPASGTEDAEPILADDFSDPESGWSTYDGAEAIAQYDDGAFRISVREEQYVVWSSLPQEFDDFAVEVSTARVAGSAINACGVFARLQDEDNLYEFAIDGEGYFMVGKYVDGEWMVLVDWQESDALDSGPDASNDLAVICIDNELSFYANGELLTTVVDDSFAEGQIALFAETFDEGGMDIRFDDLSVWPVP